MNKCCLLYTSSHKLHNLMLLERDFESVKYPETTKIITDSHYDLKGKSSREPQKKKKTPESDECRSSFYHPI